jgi:hypothetical protein
MCVVGAGCAMPLELIPQFLELLFILATLRLHLSHGRLIVPHLQTPTVVVMLAHRIGGRNATAVLTLRSSVCRCERGWLSRSMTSAPSSSK